MAPYKTVSVIARAVVDFSLVESPGKNVGYTDVGGDCPIFYMSNETVSYTHLTR